MSSATRRTVRIITVTIVTGSLCTAGCTPRAAALPAGFPDLNKFSAVPVENYITTGPKGPGRWVNFSTPYNIECQFDAAPEPIQARSSQALHCDGDMPGMGSVPYVQGSPVQGWCDIGTVRTQNSGSLALNRESVMCPPRPFNSGALLSAGQKVSSSNVTCAVGAGQLVACLDTNSGQHGFVLKPSGSEAF